MPTPIFVVGPNRCGTKLLSNLLARHSKIAVAQSPNTGGIIETNMFCEMPQKFDLRFPDDYVAFLTILAKTEFVHATKVETDFMWSLKPRPTDFRCLFRILMEEYARAKQCDFWLQKTSPVRAQYALAKFTDAKVIVVTRELGAAVHSHITSENKQFGERFRWRIAFRKRAEIALAEKICSRYQGVHVTYEELIENREDLLQGLCEYIGVPFEQEVLETGFNANSSFNCSDAGYRRPGVPANIVRLATIANLIPDSVLRLASVRDSSRRNAQFFIRGTFYTERENLADRKSYK